MSKNKGGRPSVYSTKIKPNLKLIALLRNHGIYHDDIAKMLNIAPSTYYKHKKEIEEFSESSKKSDESLVEKIEASMYDLALGKAKSTKIEYRYNEIGEEIAVKKTVEHLPADKVAQFFVLTNLAPNRWKHKQENTITDENDDIVDSFWEALKNEGNQKQK